MSAPTLARCYACQQDKSTAEFYRDKTKSRGFGSICKDCDKAKRKALYWADGHQPSIKWAAPRRRRIARTKTCPVCGDAFTTKRDEQTFCSGLCRNKSRIKPIKKNRLRRLQPGSKTSSYRRDDIFARDGWTCQMCGMALDRDQRHPEPLAPTIDHIIPLALGGDDAPYNLQAAHSRCNRRKGASMPTALDELYSSGIDVVSYLRSAAEAGGRLNLQAHAPLGSHSQGSPPEFA